MQSREELAEIFERSVNLFLNVKVNPNWRKNDALLKKMFDIM
jgi:GTPase Era involved in 16S rRNA processing